MAARKRRGGQVGRRGGRKAPPASPPVRLSRARQKKLEQKLERERLERLAARRAEARRRRKLKKAAERAAERAHQEQLARRRELARVRREKELEAERARAEKLERRRAADRQRRAAKKAEEQRARERADANANKRLQPDKLPPSKGENKRLQPDKLPPSKGENEKLQPVEPQAPAKPAKPAKPAAVKKPKGKAAENKKLQASKVGQEKTPDEILVEAYKYGLKKGELQPVHNQLIRSVDAHGLRFEKSRRVSLLNSDVFDQMDDLVELLYSDAEELDDYMRSQPYALVNQVIPRFHATWELMSETKMLKSGSPKRFFSKGKGRARVEIAVAFNGFGAVKIERFRRMARASLTAHANGPAAMIIAFHVGGSMRLPKRRGGNARPTQ